MPDNAPSFSWSEVVPGGGTAKMMNVHSLGFLGTRTMNTGYHHGVDNLLLSSKCHDCCISYSSWRVRGSEAVISLQLYISDNVWYSNGLHKTSSTLQKGRFHPFMIYRNMLGLIWHQNCLWSNLTVVANKNRVGLNVSCSWAWAYQDQVLILSHLASKRIWQTMWPSLLELNFFQDQTQDSPKHLDIFGCMYQHLENVPVTFLITGTDRVKSTY